MKAIHFLLISLIVLLLTILFMWTQEQLPAASGMLHPSIKGMLKSGSTVSDSAVTKWASFIFGLSILMIFASSMALGIKRNAMEKKVLNRLVLFFGSYTIVYILFVRSYWNFNTDTSENFFGSFPLPTAWMLYGIYLFPLILTISIILNFNSWILSPEDKERFNEILKNRKSKQQQ